MRFSKKGMALLIVLALVMMLLVLGAAGVMISTGHFSSSYRQLKRAQAYYAAEAALQHALWDLRTNGATPGNITLPADFDVNGIEDTDITITVGNLDAEIPGVHRVDVYIANY